MKLTAYYYLKVKMLSQKGQALLEITLATGLSVIVVTAIMVTTIIGLRNSQFAQNQLQATKLAQAGLETVRAIKDSNLPICYPAVSPIAYYWFLKPTAPQLIWAQTLTDPTYFSLNSSGSCAGGLTATVSTTGDPIPNISNGIFKRQIVITNTPVAGVSTLMQVKVIVIWTDFAGSHQSTLISYINSK